MAHEIKLDVYTLQVKKHGKEEYINFDSFYLGKSKSDANEKAFKEFFEDYIKSFKNKFSVQESTGKAINISSKNLKFGTEKRIIYGLAEGGSTGIGSKIKKKEDISDETAFQVTTEMVESIPYYFILWIPNDSNFGLLIIQGLGNKTIGDVFKAHLKGFFNKSTNGISLLINEHIPKEAEKKMKENGAVNSVVLRRIHLPSAKAEKILGLKYVPEELNIEIKISGLKKINGFTQRLSDFFTGKSTQLFDISSLNEYGIDGKHDVLINFEHDGKTAVGKLSENFKLSPTYYINEEDIIRDSFNHPTFESINKYCKSFLEEMKKEIGYKKIK